MVTTICRSGLCGRREFKPHLEQQILAPISRISVSSWLFLLLRLPGYFFVLVWNRGFAKSVFSAHWVSLSAKLGKSSCWKDSSFPRSAGYLEQFELSDLTT